MFDRPLLDTSCRDVCNADDHIHYLQLCWVAALLLISEMKKELTNNLILEGSHCECSFNPNTLLEELRHLSMALDGAAPQLILLKVGELLNSLIFSSFKADSTYRKQQGSPCPQ